MDDEGACPLPPGDQTRNLALFASNQALIYLGAPVMYVGIVQAALLQKLGTSPLVANLPATVYFWATPAPILAAWYFHAGRQLKPVLAGTYLVLAAAGAAAAASIQATDARWLTASTIVIQSALLGAGLGVVSVFHWEVLAHGISAARRGRALALAFGAGPVLAFLSSLASQWLLTRIAYPENFTILFAATAVILLASAVLSTQYVVPLSEAAREERQPFVPGVLGGFADFCRSRLLLVTSVALVLVSAGHNILTNMSLFTKEALGTESEAYAGYANAFRFGFKIAAGFFLGWLLTKLHPKAGLLVISAFCLAGVAWVMLVPGIWFLVCFGWMGAGELWGVYYPNYILTVSPKPRVRQNMAMARMLNMPGGFAPMVYGAIAGGVGDLCHDRKIGFQASFTVAIGLIVAGMILVGWFLPARPQAAAD